MSDEGMMLLISVGLIVALIFGTLGLSKLNFTAYGEHNGYVTAVDQKGMVWKNYQVYFKTDNQSSQEDVYCLPFYKEELANNLRKLSRSRQRINLQYQGLGFSSLAPSECGGEVVTNYIIEK